VSRWADNASNQVTDSLEVKAVSRFAFNHFPHKGGLAPLLGDGAETQRDALRSWEPDS
jgi:hypothetical protein